jgi:polysaccharide export outer membrane protein
MHISPLMKLKYVWFLRFPLLLASTLLVLGLAGCATDKNIGLMDPPEPNGSTVLPRLSVGDTVLITLGGLPIDLLPQDKQIADDGTITLPDIGPIQAAGKKPHELESYIHDQYVPRFYTHISVTVKRTSDQVYFVRGEVKAPGRLIYVGPITVSKAITSAGDFTDFANHSKVYLTRSNSGKRFLLDDDKILNGEAPDPPVFPGDQIEVKRRRL